MSWDIFKQNIISKSQNPRIIKNSEDMAILYATEYQNCIKRGGDLINKIPLRSGNFDTMVDLFKLSFALGSRSKIPFDIIGTMGKGVMAYWAGARLQPFPIPNIPAPGSIKNILVLSGIVINPGIWTPSIPPIPSPTPDPFIDLFVLSAKIHLNTVSGFIFTLSTYPPSVISPGVILWNSYRV
jgi:hypothetical protein